MRVAMLTNLTAHASLPVLIRLVESQQLELQHVFFYNTLAAGRTSPVQILRQFGLKKIGTKALHAVGGKFRAKLGRLTGAKWCPPRSAYEYAVIHRLPYSLTSDMNSAQSQAQLSAIEVDVLVVCVCKNILRAPLLALPGLEFVNIHPSLLPHYRGPTPTFWMLYYDEQQTGFTVHRMTPQVDRGEVLSQGLLPLDDRQTELQIELRVFAAAADALEEVLLSLRQTRSAAAGISDHSSGSYYSYPTATQRLELRQRLNSRRAK